MEIDYLIRLNPDVYKRKSIIKKIKENGGYCLSKTEKTEDTKCHCLKFKKTGFCECGLFSCVPVVEITCE